MNGKLLLVEDDDALGYVVKDNLEQAGFEVFMARDGESGLEQALMGNFDLIILDVMLPKLDGFHLAERIREQDERVPILFLSAKSLLEDRLEGLRKGGDDYLTKPFSMEELLLKIEIFLKRSASAPSGEVYQLGSYSFDPANLELRHNQKSSKLTQKESNLLDLLCRNEGMVLKREEILLKVWGSDDYFLGRSMDVFISKLRKHLREDPRISIVNYHGVGFRLEVED